MKKRPDKYKMMTRIIALFMAGIMLLASVVAVVFAIFA